MKTLFNIAILLLLIPLGFRAQFNVGFALDNSIRVLRDADTMSMPWAGGLNNPQFSAYDFLPDAGQELFVFDRDGALTKGFRFNPNTGKMHWVPYYYDGEDSLPFERLFPELENGGWSLLVDYDQDGKEDLFSGFNYDQITVFRNTGSATSPFETNSGSLMTKNGSIKHPIRIFGNKLPVIKDLNDDGDLDIMFFASNLAGQAFGCGTFATFTNLSMDEFNHADSLRFVVDDRCWGKITPSGGTTQNNWKPFNCDTSCNLSFTRGSRDITMTQALHDLNGNGNLDLIIVNDHFDELFAMYNIGSSEHGTIDLSLNDDDFPANSQQVKLANQPYPYFIDIDHDEDDDMLVGANQTSKANSLEYDTSGSKIVDQLYLNTGSDASPVFNFEKNGYLSGEMIDVGIRSFPAYGDLTGDGLPELIIGNSGYSVFNPDLSPAYISYYKNLGTESAPLYKLVNTNLAEATSLNLYIAHPTLGDLDNDGDLDMIIGDGHGYLHYFKNQGTSSSIDFELFGEKYKGIHVSGEAHPQLFDMNKDGLLDLVVGDADGRIHYFENDGSSSSPNFDQSPTITGLGSINLLNTRGGVACPYFTRNLDSTDRLYLFIGTENGIVNVYGPIDNFLGEYTLGDSLVVEAQQTSITGLDLIGDSRDELCIGQRSGGLYLLNRENNQGVGISKSSRTHGELRVYPNPSSGQSTFVLRSIGNHNARLVITDLKGHQLSSKLIVAQNGYFNENIDLRNYPSGVYLVSVIENEAISWSKIILE